MDVPAPPPRHPSRFPKALNQPVAKSMKEKCTVEIKSSLNALSHNSEREEEGLWSIVHKRIKASVLKYSPHPPHHHVPLPEEHWTKDCQLPDCTHQLKTFPTVRIRGSILAPCSDWSSGKTGLSILTSRTKTLLKCVGWFGHGE